MKNLTFTAVLALLLTVRIAQAGVEFKAYSFANFGSPFVYRPTTADDLTSALNGGTFPFSDGTATLGELFQIGQTSISQEYDVGGGLHVAFAASADYRPAEPLSGAAPGIGAKASASNNQNPGANTVIGESYVYLKETLSVENLNGFDQVMKKYDLTVSLDGVVQVGGDAISLVGEAVRISLDNGSIFTTSNMRTFQPGIGGLTNYFNFGQPGPVSDSPITLTQAGLYGTQLIARQIRTVTFETLLYVRAQSGISRGAGSASADFSNTLRVSNIRFYDDNDQVIPGLQVTGSNGDVYPYNAVPEPSILALFGVGCSGLLFARLRRT